MDGEGVALMVRQDIEAFAETKGTPLVRLAFVLTGDGDEARDVVQAVFLRLLRADLVRVADLTAYARRAVFNEVASRRRRRIRFLPLPAQFEPPASSGQEAQIADRQWLLAALKTLSVRQRTVLALRYLEDLADPEIGEIVGCSPATVRSISARGLTKLRAEMTPVFEHDRSRHGGP